MSIRVNRLSWAILVLIAGAPAAHAQFAVIDVASVTQLIMQVRTLQQELATARDHLEQARAEFQSITGGRGMERLLSGTVRNYLPSDWTQLASILQNAGGAFGVLSVELQNIINQNAVLTASQVASLSPNERQHLDAVRRSVAMLQVLAHRALVTTSNRFGSLQQLIDAISAAGDQKAILDLQARIGAETSMLQNEQTKLHVLYQSMQAEQWANEQRVRERVVAGHGQFGARFEPLP